MRPYTRLENLRAGEQRAPVDGSEQSDAPRRAGVPSSDEADERVPAITLSASNMIA
jgi:hypothetical protein